MEWDIDPDNIDHQESFDISQSTATMNEVNYPAELDPYSFRISFDPNGFGLRAKYYEDGESGCAGAVEGLTYGRLVEPETS